MARSKKLAKKRGRPKLPPGEGKRHPLNMRTTKEIRERLEAAARASGRSLAQEAEFRLQQSFGRDEIMAETWGGTAALQVWLACASAAKALAVKNGVGWLDDPLTFAQAKHATGLLFDIFGPEGPAPAKKTVGPARMAVAHVLCRIGHDIAGLPVPDALDEQSQYDSSVLEAAKAIEKII